MLLGDAYHVFNRVLLRTIALSHRQLQAPDHTIVAEARPAVLVDLLEVLQYFIPVRIPLKILFDLLFPFEFLVEVAILAILDLVVHGTKVGDGLLTHICP